MIEDFFRKVLSKHVGEFELIRSNLIGSGCINNTAKVQTSNHAYFIKWKDSSGNDLFQKEEKGLILLNESKEIQIPEVLGRGELDNKAYLLLEWIESGYASSSFWDLFGKSLAKLHQHESSHFGLDHNNYIGKLFQSNKKHDKWSDFFISERLNPQLKLAYTNKLIDTEIITLFEKFYLKLEHLIPNEKPSLLHGDLWSGNFLTGQHAQPVLIDPAVHFGHRETELSFTRLFGGFDSTFYNSYCEEFPLESDFENRIDIHNLYPLLVHVNLFGSSYLAGIKQTLKRFS